MTRCSSSSEGRDLRTPRAGRLDDRLQGRGIEPRHEGRSDVLAPADDRLANEQGGAAHHVGDGRHAPCCGSAAPARALPGSSFAGQAGGKPGRPPRLAPR